MCSNNTNKLSPQELLRVFHRDNGCSNNTNKLSPQDPTPLIMLTTFRSNNTNKLSPQELNNSISFSLSVQIIQINLALKNKL